MYCIKCGKLLPEGAVFCPSCGSPCNSSNSSNIEQIQEQIIMKGICNRVKNPLYVQNGNAMLTNKRFIYLKHNIAKTMLIGLWVNITKGSYDFDIPIEDIVSIEDGRQGLSKTIIINTRSGEQYNFYFSKREEWKIHLENAIRSNRP